MLHTALRRWAQYTVHNQRNTKWTQTVVVSKLRLVSYNYSRHSEKHTDAMYRGSGGDFSCGKGLPTDKSAHAPPFATWWRPISTEYRRMDSGNGHRRCCVAGPHSINTRQTWWVDGCACTLVTRSRPSYGDSRKTRVFLMQVRSKTKRTLQETATQALDRLLEYMRTRRLSAAMARCVGRGL